MDALPIRSEEALKKQYYNNRNGRSEHSTLREQIIYPKPKNMWQTPTAHFHNESNSPSEKNRHTPSLISQIATNNDTCYLNPDWVELLMGWPKGWTSLDSIKIDIDNWKYFKWDNNWETGTPRISTTNKNRSNRLKAIGNGQVPQTIYIAWNLLTNNSKLCNEEKQINKRWSMI